MNAIYMLRIRTLILMLSISAILFLPDSLFAQGAVIGYADGKKWIGTSQYQYYTTFPSDAQLDRLTHVIATGGIGCNNNGSLYTGVLPENWSNGNPPGSTWNNGNKNLWLTSLVSRAHLKGVKVSIMVGGDYFIDATSSSVLGTFVANIVSFVNLHGLDGVDINWEYPSGATQWNQCINLLNALKNHSQLSGKRISIDLSHGGTWSYPSQTVQQNIWNAVDAIHLMTYDEGAWPDSHSNAAYSIGAIDNWITGGTPNSYKKKLFLGCAFYGWHPVVGNNRVPYSTYSGAGFSGNRGDLPADVTAKTNHCYGNGYGGVFVWELGYDVAATGTNPPSLLNAIWNANDAQGGYPSVSIITQPATSTTVIHGNISGSLSIKTNKPSIDVIYQWYANTTNSNTGGTLISGAVNANFPIPTDLVTGTYYYFCEVKSGRSTVRSGVAEITVTTPPIPPTITGPTLVCTSGATFTATNWQQGYTWSSSSNISISGSGSNMRASQQSVGGEGWISIKSNGSELVRKTVWVGPPFAEEIDGVIYPFSADATYVAVFPAISAPTSWSWRISGYFHGNMTSWQNQAYLHFDLYSYFFLYVKGTNVCGTDTGEQYICIYASPPIPYSISSYPNPVSDILNINIDAQATSLATITTTARQIKPDPTYDVRLYDGQGNLLRQQKTKGGTVQFNVAGLPNGVYYLHIYDGMSEKPEMRQIVVEH